MAVAYRLIFQSQESHSCQVFYIYKCNTLGSKSYSKIKAGLYTLDLHKIIFLTGTIYTGRTQDHIREMRLAAHIVLRHQFTLPISRIGLLRIIQTDRTESRFISLSVTAQAAHQEKLFRLTPGSGQSLYKMMRIFSVNMEEVLLIQRLGQAGIMDHIIPGTLFTDKVRQLGCQRLLIIIFQVDKTDPFILQVFATACCTYTCPGFISSAQRFLH